MLELETVLHIVGAEQVVDDLHLGDPTMHEADLTKLEVLAAERMGERTEKSALQTICRQRGLSQAQLAKASGVSLRMIQLYEQGRRDIQKAEAWTIAALADALNCEMQAII